MTHFQNKKQGNPMGRRDRKHHGHGHSSGQTASKSETNDAGCNNGGPPTENVDICSDGNEVTEMQTSTESENQEPSAFYLDKTILLPSSISEDINFMKNETLPANDDKNVAGTVTSNETKPQMNNLGDSMRTEDVEISMGWRDVIPQTMEQLDILQSDKKHATVDVGTQFDDTLRSKQPVDAPVDVDIEIFDQEVTEDMDPSKNDNNKVQKVHRTRNMILSAEGVSRAELVERFETVTAAKELFAIDNGNMKVTIPASVERENLVEMMFDKVGSIKESCNRQIETKAQHFRDNYESSTLIESLLFTISAVLLASTTVIVSTVIQALLLPYYVPKWILTQIWQIMVITIIWVLQVAPGGHIILEALNGHVSEYIEVPAHLM